MQDEDLLLQLEPLLWAKSEPFKPLCTHLLETGFVAQTLITEGCFIPLKMQLMRQTRLSETEIVHLVGYLAATHDLGKIHPAFIGNGACSPALEFLKAHKLDYIATSGFRHEKYGAICLRRIWKEQNRFSSMSMRRTLSYIIANHHQGKKDSNAGALPPDKVLFWNVLQNKMEKKLWNIFSPPEDFLPMNMDAFCMILLGIVIAADWIASGETFIDEVPSEQVEMIKNKTISHTIQFLQHNYLIHQEGWGKVRSFTELWPFIFREGMRPLQVKVEEIFQQENKPLAIILEAPMGEGKTEAALYAASQLSRLWHKEGFYVALPTAATSNQMYARINSMLDRFHLQQAKLMHSMAWIVHENNWKYTGEEALNATLWTEPMRLGLITPFAVGTIDQVMMAVMRVKYGVLRLIGLTDKVLIIDELHSYDAYMSKIISTLLIWCRVLQIPVVMLSATLPAGKKEEYATIYDSTVTFSEQKSYPCITAFYENMGIQQYPVTGSHQKMDIAIELLPILNNTTSIAVLVVQEVEKNSGCYCVLCNTVNGAQKLYQEVMKLDEHLPVLLFHARFHAKRRNELEKECIQKLGVNSKKRPEKLLVIATQVVEQSLDVDFDYIFTDICPLDLLFQRIGRLWRHEETKRPQAISQPKVSVFIPTNNDFGVTGIVYPPIILEKSLNILKNKTILHLPDDIPSFVNQTYSNDIVDSNALTEWIEYKMDEELDQSSAQGISLPDPNVKKFWLSRNAGDLFDDDNPYILGKTRLGEETCRLAFIPNKLFHQIQTMSWVNKKFARIILLYSVSVSKRMVQKQLGLACKNGEKALQGNGLLYGITIYPAEHGICEFIDGSRFILDNQLGFIIGDEIDDL